MTPPEENLQESYRLFGQRDYKKALKAAEKARKEFVKKGLDARALEALRVIGDSSLNGRDLKAARSYYEELLSESHKRSAQYYQAAANWGLGEAALFQMDYNTAARHFKAGLEQATSVGDKWYMAWNSYGLGKTSRGLGRLDDAKRLLNEARIHFKDQNQSTFVTWTEHALNEMGGETSSRSPGAAKMYLCPMCGSKFDVKKAQDFIDGKLVSCDYCGTTVG